MDGTGKLLVRLVVGGVFVGHGLQKLKGAFGGPGLEGTEKMVASMGMEPAPVHARAAALSETLGGAALIAGAATPAASAALIATMTTAIRKVHWKNGLWNSNGGFEFNAVLIAVATALATDGPGKFSIDAAFGKSRWGLLGGLVALGGGVAASIAAVEYGRRTAEANSELTFVPVGETAPSEASATAPAETSAEATSGDTAADAADSPADA